MILRPKSAIIAVALLVGMLAPATAATIVQRLPGSVVNDGYTMGTANGANWFSTSWTQDAASNVSISVYLAADYPAQSPANFGFYLSTAIGPTAAPTDVVASTTLPVADGSYILRQLFSGLNLAANTYYLSGYINTNNDGYGSVGFWGYTNGPSVQGDLGPVYISSPGWPTDNRNFASPLNSTWASVGGLDLTLLVESADAPVPEPSTLVMMAPLAGLALYLRRRATR